MKHARVHCLNLFGYYTTIKDLKGLFMTKYLEVMPSSCPLILMNIDDAAFEEGQSYNLIISIVDQYTK